MNCNIQVLTGVHAGSDFDGVLTRLGKVVFYTSSPGGKLRKVVTNRSNPDINVRRLQRVSIADLVKNQTSEK